MKDKNILIFGDSYSTFKGYIPEGYSCYYPHDNENDVTDVTQTWWNMLCLETNSKILLNNSWSGSTVCNTGYGGDCSKSSSFIWRLSQLTEKGFFNENKIDKVFVFGGTNDSWTGNACGQFIFEDWTNEDLFRVLPGYTYFINQLLKVIEKDKIHIIVNCNLRAEVESGIIETAKHYGICYTKLTDIEKIEGHPTVKGMTQIKNQVLKTVIF